MQKYALRAGAAAVAVILSAAVGLATNVLTDHPSWGVGTATVLLVIFSAILAAASPMLERPNETHSPHKPSPPEATRTSSLQNLYALNGRTAQAGRDINNGMPAKYVALCLFIFAVAVLTILLVTTGPVSHSEKKNVEAMPTSPEPGELRYRLSASPVESCTVRLTVNESGQPNSWLTYWFFIEVYYDNGYTEYYPDRRVAINSADFDVSIPGRAETKWNKIGRIYGLENSQNAQANKKLERKEIGTRDFFEKPPGQPVSNAVKLPFRQGQVFDNRAICAQSREGSQNPEAPVASAQPLSTTTRVTR